MNRWVKVFNVVEFFLPETQACGRVPAFFVFFSCIVTDTKNHYTDCTGGAMTLTQAQRRKYIKAYATQQAKSVKRDSVSGPKGQENYRRSATALSSKFTLKIYAIGVTILFAILFGFQSILFSIEKRDIPMEIATFSDAKGQPGQFRLTYSANGDLTFTTGRLQSPIPSITYWDYYGATEIRGYNWISDNTILIETNDSTIKIVIPEFKVIAKNSI